MHPSSSDEEACLVDTGRPGICREKQKWWWWGAVGMAAVVGMILLAVVPPVPADRGPLGNEKSTNEITNVVSDVAVQHGAKRGHASQLPGWHAESREPLTPAEHLPWMWQVKHLPWVRSRVRDTFAGRWCSAVWTAPHYGSMDISDLCANETTDLRTANVDFPTVDSTLELLQFERLRAYLEDHSSDYNHRLYEEAFEALKKLSQLEAKNIFAFRETWSDEDTQLLKGLDAGANGFVPGGDLTTKAFAARLPSVEDLKQVLGQSLAIVGGAGSLTGRGLGQEIDAHDEVVRFNEIVGSKLLPNETGTKTSVHVMCSKVAPLQDPAVLEIDLETNTMWRSYCGRMHSGGEFANITDKPLLIRPSAYCELSKGHAESWTRGFMFYWFIGRLFRSVDLYGFSGNGHYNNQQPIFERWLPFEHLFYHVNKLARH